MNVNNTFISQRQSTGFEPESQFQAAASIEELEDELRQIGETKIHKEKALIEMKSSKMRKVKPNDI